MALRVINDIVSFQEELEAQAYNEVHFGFNRICVEG